MNRFHSATLWRGPTAAGILLAVVFLVLVAVSPTVRHYWLLLILSAGVTAAPILLRAPTGPVTRLLSPKAVHPSVIEPTSAATLVVFSVSMSKANATPGEIEDAYGADAAGGYVAVADGASASFRAAEWAQTLCGTFLDRRPLDGMPSLAWIADATVAFARTEPDDLDMWSLEAAKRGAHAAFVGLAVARQEQGLIWRATAVGDCVLVHLRDAADGLLPIVTAFPIAHSAAFPAAPMLLSSAADRPPPVHDLTGSASFGDTWLLMTDELARWTLRSYEAGDPLWDLLARGTESEIREAIMKARTSRLVADDDMTIVRCTVIPAN